MRILLAESDKILARMIRMMLARSGYEAECVESGTEAIEYLKCGNYDGAIVDTVLMQLSGFDVLYQIRQSGLHTPVLMLTGKENVEETVMLLDGGANDCMTKPFDSRELVARVRAMTRKGVQPTPPVMTLGDIALDKRNFQLSSPHGKFTLTNKEFQILEMLILNPAALVSTDTIYEKVWGYDNNAEINVIWVNISSIRKKLAALNGRVRIKTVRNVGYMIEECE